MAEIKIETVDEYIRTFEEEVQVKLSAVRKIIKEEAADAKEVISWGMATYKLNGNLIHFAGHKNHIGIYPGPDAILQFEHEIKEQNYKYSKGAFQIPLKGEIPEDMLRRILKYRLESVLE